MLPAVEHLRHYAVTSPKASIPVIEVIGVRYGEVPRSWCLIYLTEAPARNAVGKDVVLVHQLDKEAQSPLIFAGCSK